MEEDYVKRLIDSKGKSSAIYAQYIYDHDKYPDKLFCFFEGEDYKYYRTRIIQYMDVDEDDIFHYNCNGKKEVLKVYEDLYDEKELKKIFFIDKDFDEDIDNEDIFQTECYSIENYYVTDSAFKHFLLTEFEMNISNNNFKKCLEDYIKGRERFNNIITLLNAYICYIRKRDKNVAERIKLPKSKDILNKFIRKIEVDKIIENPRKSIEDIKKILNDYREVDESKILKLKNKFKLIKKKELVFRGKFQIYFLKKFISDLIFKVNRKEYFEEYGKRITLDINDNIITSFSTYAETTEKLKKFLLKMKQRYFKE